MNVRSIRRNSKSPEGQCSVTLITQERYNVPVFVEPQMNQASQIFGEKNLPGFRGEERKNQIEQAKSCGTFEGE